MYYIGSKLLLLDFLNETISNITGFKTGDNYVFADLFAGTGTVGSFYKDLGCTVISNDVQYYSYCMNKHYIENNSSNVRKDLFDYFNSLPEVEGFVYKNYCLGSGSGRNYFIDSNGKKCDAIRIELQRMYDNKEIDKNTYYYYLASLIDSIDKYANTAATYGAFLKHTKKTAQKEFVLEPLKIVDGPTGEVFNENANDLIKHISGEVLYLDPPYNSRQYCSNYHVLETIAKYDNPVLEGMTGLRGSLSKRSDFCSKRVVEKAFEELISNAKFKYIFLSYNNEGLMSHETIKEIMSKYGEYSCHTKVYRRYKSYKNKEPDTNETLEYLHCLIKKDV